MGQSTPPRRESPTTVQPSPLSLVDLMLRCWRLLHWLSLDVALGAGVSAAWVNRAWGGDFSWSATLAISSGALLVYSLDHWADAGRVGRFVDLELLSARRKFYVERRGTLGLLALISIFLGCWSALHLPWVTLSVGGLFIIACGLYLISAQHNTQIGSLTSYPKEVMVALIYTLSLTVWPFSQLFIASMDFQIFHGGLTSLLMLCLAGANVCLISAHERRLDAAEGGSSMALRWGEFTTRNIGRGVLRAGWFIWIILYIPVFWQEMMSLRLGLEAGVNALMLGTLWRLYRRPEWSAISSRYRRWADLVFLYPAFVLIMERGLSS